MSDLVKITGLSAKGFHGVLDSEKQRGQKFIIDVEMSVSVSNLKDDLSKTVNYAQAAQLIHDQITGKPVRLIETLAENIAKTLLKEFKTVKKVKVIVHKPKAPISLKFLDVSVEITRKR